MAITQKKPTAPSESDFIAAAPDSVKKIKTLGKKSIITLSIDPTVLARVDAWAKEKGLSRAAAVSLAVSKLD